MLYTRIDNRAVRCLLCRHYCIIKPSQKGLCNVRENINGRLYTSSYGRPITIAVDPIEKKPLFHFLPGSVSLSIATLGCNFRCPFCQNWNISQYGNTHTNCTNHNYVSPQDIVNQAKVHNCASISYTYTEPTVFFEYAYDTGNLARQEGIKNIFVTNGYMSPETISAAAKFLDAANVDLKAFKEDTYRKVMKAKLSGVLDSITKLKKEGVWVEITTLIVPGMNDDMKEIKRIADFIVTLDKSIPWHISRFYPAYKTTTIEPTPIETLRRAYEVGKSAGLRYVYIGNVPGDDTENTYCYQCGTMLINRIGYHISKNIITKNGKCPHCHCTIDIVT